MALVKIISNLQSNRLGQMSDIEAFTKGSLLSLSICSGIVTISAALIVLQAVIKFKDYVKTSGNISTDIQQIFKAPLKDVSESTSAFMNKVGSSISKTIDSYSTDSLLSK